MFCIKIKSQLFVIMDKIIGEDIEANREVNLGLTEEQIVSERNRELLVFKIVLSECGTAVTHQNCKKSILRGCLFG